MPVDVGPFQSIVNVSWGGVPSLLVVKESHQKFASDGSFAALVMNTVILSEFPDGVIGPDGGTDTLNGVIVGRETSNMLRGPGSQAHLIDLRKVREAFALGPLGDGAGVVPAFVTVEVRGYITFSDPGPATPAALEYRSHGGPDAYGIEVERGSGYYDWSIFDGSGVTKKKDSGGFQPDDGSRPGDLVATLHARLDRLGFGNDEGSA